ncbi:MAG TPA: RDD family protein [Mycobacterium sp.]
MTAVLDATPSAPAEEPSPTVPLASWLARAGAFALDVLFGTGVIAVLALLAYLALTVPQPGWLWWVYAVAAAVIFLLMAVNRLLLPAITGWSLGRAVFGIRVVHRRDGAAVGAWRLLARDLAHLLDTAALFVGWLWPLWDSRRRTFADLLLRTEVRRVDPPQRDMRRLAAKVLVAAVVVCAAAVALNYVVVYRHERAVDQTRQQIADQGPRIVEQMLSYGKDTLNDDFARAQSLATDSYRSQLVTQQQAVEKAGATTNEYWAVSSAVLSASPDQAAMLLAMQGQRGTNSNDLRFITATVRADFEKSRAAEWRVANLTVLKKPNMNTGAPQ